MDVPLAALPPLAGRMGREGRAGAAGRVAALRGGAGLCESSRGGAAKVHDPPTSQAPRPWGPGDAVGPAPSPAPSPARAGAGPRGRAPPGSQSPRSASPRSVRAGDLLAPGSCPAGPGDRRGLRAEHLERGWRGARVYRRKGRPGTGFGERSSLPSRRTPPAGRVRGEPEFGEGVLVEGGHMGRQAWRGPSGWAEPQQLGRSGGPPGAER